MGGGGNLINCESVEKAPTDDFQPMIYQFKISLRGTKPKIWRRILVPGDYNFDDLDAAIQYYMGWYTGMYPHKFEVENPVSKVVETLRPGYPHEQLLLNDEEALPEIDAQISDYFVAKRSKALYTYDFKARWEHKIILEKVFPAIPEHKYPRCIGGKQACPPEYCRGVLDYYDLWDAFKDPSNPDHEISKEYFDEDFDPHHFDLKSLWNGEDD